MDLISQALSVVRKEFPEIAYKTDEPMKNHTSFKIGGSVRAMFLPQSAEQFSALLGILHGFGIEPFIMGNGTNLLVCDKPLEMAVIKTTGLSELKLTGAREITAGSGVLLSRLAVFACGHGLSGLEFAHGIPGTLGGAVSMNAGAYGGEMKEIITITNALGSGNRFFTVNGDEHGFSYRKSRFSDTSDVILSSVIKLSEGDESEIRAKMDNLSVRRRESQPLNLPSAGSTFKRPKGGYAAELIDKAGLKGFLSGRAQVSEKHAGFIVNLGGATFDDVLAVIEHVRETVYNRFNIELEPEVKILRGGDLQNRTKE